VTLLGRLVVLTAADPDGGAVLDSAVGAGVWVGLEFA
jgi:hypothetical protein